MTEVWKPIPDWPYEVSSEGCVRRLITAKRGPGRIGDLMKQHVRPDGYCVVTLSNNMRRKVMRVHQLVARAFHGSPKNYVSNGGTTILQVVHHRNGVRNENRASNLKWATQSENRLAAIHDHGCPKGGDHHNSQLTDDDVRDIRRSPCTGKELADYYGVAGTTILSARAYRTWGHIDSIDRESNLRFNKQRTRGEQHPNSKLTDDDIRAIRCSRLPYTELSRFYGVSRGNISSVKTYRTWKHVDSVRRRIRPV